MLTSKDSDRFARRVVASLVIVVTTVFGSLTYAVSNVQTYW